MYRAVARILRGDVACVIAGAGILAFVVTTNAEKLVRGTASVGTPEVIESTVNMDRTGQPTRPDNEPDWRLAIPRPQSSGGSASGGIAGGDPATSQSAGFELGEGFAVGYIDAQVGWTAGTGSLTEPHVETANPSPGDQHLRIGHDTKVGAGALIQAFSPNMGTFTNTSAVVSMNLYLTGVTTRDYQVIPQNPTEGLVVTRVEFRRTLNAIRVLDDIGAGGAFIDTGATWIPDTYVPLSIDLNATLGTVTISYNNVVIYTMVTLPFGTAVEEVVLRGTNGGGATPGHADIDLYDVDGGPLPIGACCNFDGMSGCDLLSLEACNTAGGTYLGNDSVCLDCPMGACCNSDGMDGCVVITPEECAGIADAFYFGDATVCDDCPAVPDACGPGAGDCLVAHAGPGCDDVECCALVCDAIPTCCIAAFGWDAGCAAAAIDTFCVPDPACGVPGTGSCTDGNSTPFCDDTCGVDGPCPGCCDTVCAVDPFCCDTEWDVLCDGEALDLCGCKPGEGPPNDDCIDATEVFVGPAVGVATFCGTPGGPDHLTCNDGFVTGLGIDVWFFHNATFDGALNIIPTPDDDATWNTQMAIYEGCDCGSLSDPPLVCGPIDGTATVTVVNGNCYLIRLGGTFDGATGSGLLQLAAVPDACLDATNNCLESAGTTGCSDLSCCAVVCLADPDCCTVAWDQACADAAQLSCAPLPCPALDTAGANVEENEICGLDTNGGCNSDPAMFTEIVSGDVIHGTAWADLASRDTDWHRLTIDPAADVNLDGTVDIHFSVISEMPVVSFLIRDLDPTCLGTTDGPGTTAYSQSCICINPGVGNVAVTDVIYVFVGAADIGGNPIFEGYPCGVGAGPVFGNNYLLSVDVTDNGEPSPQECGVTATPCPYDCEAVPNGEVGINDFLDLLGQWAQVDSSCDIDGGGVGINDFLGLLANWGPCP